MEILIRKVCSLFVEVKVEANNTVFDLGFHDKKEAEDLSSLLLSASLELQEISQNLK